MVMTYAHAKVQGKRSVGSDDKGETDGRTDKRTDGRTRAIVLPTALMGKKL